MLKRQENRRDAGSTHLPPAAGKYSAIAPLHRLLCFVLSPFHPNVNGPNELPDLFLGCEKLFGGREQRGAVLLFSNLSLRT
jgi:hypothetical protein